MENEKKYTFGDIVDALLGFGGISIAALLTFIIFMGHQVPIPALLIVLGSWITGGAGSYRLFSRQNKKLKEEIKQLQQGYPQRSNALPANLPTHAMQAQHLPATQAVSLEVRILDLLAMRKGRITLLEAVVYLREPIDQVKPVLEKLQRDGFIGVDVSESGELIYTTDAFRVS